MNIRILGGGFYGCHLALALSKDGHDVELHESAPRLFAGASGAIPARLHQGQHYPRSRLTRAACQEHFAAFMAVYGDLSRCVPTNIYAIAEHDSLVDWGTYRQVLSGEIEFISVAKPEEYGLTNVEGAMLTGERHIVCRLARDYFTEQLGDIVRFNSDGSETDCDFTIDATFCALGGVNVDRYEPCVVGVLEGPQDKAVTIMDGPFPSLYPWDDGLCSLSSAKWTPLDRCDTREEAEKILRETSAGDILARVEAMRDQMAHFYPESGGYKIMDCLTSIRAMPRSGADARLVDVQQISDRHLQIRAGKIDAIIHAEQIVRSYLE